MNFRIDRKLKLHGDTALQSAGFTPSQAVRSLWRFAVAHSHEPEVIAREVRRLEGTPVDVSDETRARLGAYDRIRTVFSDRMATLGVSASTAAAIPEASVAELREEALLDRLSEQGTL